MTATWTADQAYLAGLDVFSHAVDSLGPDDWERPSPCAGWRARDVLGHVGQATAFGVALLRAEPVDWAPVEPPGVAVQGDPAGWWHGLVPAARDAVSGADLDRVVDSPTGRRTVAEGLAFPALDLFVHGWDIARCAGQEVAIPVEAMAFAHATLDPLPPAMLRSPRVFGPQLSVPPGADRQPAFLAWTGRDPAWAPAG